VHEKWQVFSRPHVIVNHIWTEWRPDLPEDQLPGFATLFVRTDFADTESEKNVTLSKIERNPPVLGSKHFSIISKYGFLYERQVLTLDQSECSGALFEAKRSFNPITKSCSFNNPRLIFSSVRGKNIWQTLNCKAWSSDQFAFILSFFEF